MDAPVGNVYAPTHEQAYREAVASLTPDQYAEPIRIEYDQDSPTNAILPR